MATTQYFDRIIVDVTDQSEPMEVEFGRSSYWNDENLIYLTVNDHSLIMDDATGRAFFEAMIKLGRYLGYD